MATTFNIVSVKTGLALNMINNNPGQVVQLAEPGKNDLRDQWRFLMTDTESGDFEILNAETGLQLITAGPANPSTPVVQGGQGSLTTGWTPRPPTGKHAGLGYYEIIFPAGGVSWDVGYYVMNVPDHLIGTIKGGSSGVPIQVSPGNGGQENELWQLKNTVSPSPLITFDTGNATQAGEQIGQYGAMVLPLQVRNYSGKSVNLLTLPIPGKGALANFGVGGAAPSGPVSANGRGIYQTTITIPLVGGSAPNPAPEITIVALDANSHAIAFASISSQYWYQESW